MLLSTDGLKGLQTMSIVAALPFVLIMIGMAVSLHVSLAEEQHDSRPCEIKRLHKMRSC